MSIEVIKCPACGQHRGSKGHTRACAKANQARGFTAAESAPERRPPLPFAAVWRDWSKMRVVP